MTACPGLYLIGMPFLRRRKSSLIDGAADDAAEQTQSRRIGPQVGRKVMWFDSVTLSDGQGQGRTRGPASICAASRHWRVGRWCKQIWSICARRLS